MEELYKYHQKYLQTVDLKLSRYLSDQIDWNERLIGIKGPKGVGKTTMILQHIVKKFGQSNEALYISMDNLFVEKSTIFKIAEDHLNLGGTHLYLDEIHKYKNWSKDLKTTYDLFPELKIVFTGSSMLQIYSGAADLSRRALTYNLHGLSFREFLSFETGNSLPVFTLNEVLNNHIAIAHELTSHIKILPYFNEYLKIGFFPFYLSNKHNFHLKLENVINNILEIDMPYVLGTNIQSVSKIKKLLLLLAEEVPFQPNITKLAGSLELNKATVSQYLYYLEQAGLINLLLDSGKGYSLLSKPEKIYLNNTNLAYSISPTTNIGNIRETFFFNQVSSLHEVNTSAYGDFLIDDQYTFEVGGKNKKFNQIANVENSFVVSDELITGMKNKIPLWLFGFLY